MIPENWVFSANLKYGIPKFERRYPWENSKKKELFSSPLFRRDISEKSGSKTKNFFSGKKSTPRPPYFGPN